MTRGRGSDNDFGRRLGRLEDCNELADLVVRYCGAVDLRDFELLGALYAADAVYVGAAGRFEGRASVIAYLRKALGQGASIHTVDGQVVDWLSDDEASGVVSGHVELAPGGASETAYGAVRYYDRYVREGSRWCFAQREVEFVHLGPWSKVGESLTAGTVQDETA